MAPLQKLWGIKIPALLRGRAGSGVFLFKIKTGITGYTT